MAYVALYRQYRPKTFSEVAGQEHITRTLMNALKNNKVGHAYIFSGPRGTGKTSIAKIFAKAVNCECAPISDPCNTCSICQGINNNTISDVIEIDAASNNSVEEIREIRDKVKYLPSVCKYKVYIIDEVHMLSTSAFNALLKTLEEPPKHVIFILATTEIHKIPPTILSRCQRFDFRAISIEEMTKKIEEIVAKENILITKEAINTIALNAEGGMRDALSLLDQVISFSDGQINEDDVHKVSGSVRTSKLIELMDFLCDKNSTMAMNILDELLSEGKEIPRIIFDLITFCRNILVFKNIRDNRFSLDIFNNEEFVRISKKISNQRIYFYLDILNETQNSIKWTNQKRAFLELAFIKMTDNLEVKNVEENELLYKLEKRVKELEERKIEVVPQVKKEEKIVVEPINYTTNVELIQEILRNASKSKKELMQKSWSRLNEISDPVTSFSAKLLYEGKLVACSEYEMIITYPSEYKCQEIMNDNHKRAIKKVLNRKSRLIEDYVAITEAQWEILSKEFIKQLKSGIAKPVLTGIDVNVEKRNEEVVESSFVKTTIDFFGKDKVKFEE